MKRRHFLKLMGSASLALHPASWLLSRRGWSADERHPRGKTVAILGGGVAGMSAAHELMERGFDVVVYEAKSEPGGKARSIKVPGSGTGGRFDLPGEHGFRFFPGFYRHLPDTMKRIPFDGQEQGVFENLVPATRIILSRESAPDVELVGKFPFASLEDLRVTLGMVFKHDLGLTPEDIACFAHKLWVFLTSCDERRIAEYEKITWWDFLEAGSRSEAYQKYLAIGLTRSLVAMRPELASTRTVATILVQLLLLFSAPDKQPDRVLNGPTNEVWITPWLEHLRRGGVQYHFENCLERIELEGGKVSGAWIRTPDGVKRVQADYYLCAVPAEVMARLVTPELAELEPALARISRLQVEWMTGIQFFLKRDVPVGHGHVIYIDTPWALTSISQKQFWSGIPLSQYGDGSVQGIISVDVSDWNTPGILYGKAARLCTKQQIANEVWAQLKSHLNDRGDANLRDEDVVTWFLDPGIHFEDPAEATNDEPLLINTIGSWADRPKAETRIPNLFLASDYVQTVTDLATMEAANEAARHAVNAIIETSGVSASPCRLWELEEPAFFRAEKAYDLHRFKLGLPHRIRTERVESVEV